MEGVSNPKYHSSYATGCVADPYMQFPFRFARIVVRVWYMLVYLKLMYSTNY